MSRSYIPKALREAVLEDSRHRCGYCLTPSGITGAPMEIDHLIPEVLGGLTVRENLWAACSLCNDHKACRIAAVDQATGGVVRFFNPRTQRWADHFTWSPVGDEIIGTTPIGRVTVGALRLNRAELVLARQRWIRAGWHPPSE